MTVLVGVVDDGQVIIGADRGASEGNFLTSSLTKKVKKLGTIAVAYSGSAGTGQLLYSLDYPKPDPDNLELWLRDAFIKTARLATEDARLEATNPDRHSSDLLLGVCGRLFEVSTEDWSYFEYKEIATGSGYQYALGSLHTSRGIDAKSRVKLAVQAAITYSPQCARPVDIVLV